VSFFEDISKHKIDIAALKKGLVHLRINFDKLDLDKISITDELLSFLKLIIHVDPAHTSRNEKLSLKLKFEGLLKPKSNQSENNVVDKITVPLPSIEAKKKSFDHKINPRGKKPKKLNEQLCFTNNPHIKIGRVKMFNQEKGFGFIECFDDRFDCFVHESNTDSTIIQDDIVLFETQNSTKKGNENKLEAIKVCSVIPIYIENISPNRSTAAVLADSLINNSRALVEQLPSQFCYAKIEFKSRSWRVNPIDSKEFEIKKIKPFGINLLKKHLKLFKNNSQDLVYLYDKLEATLSDSERSEILATLISELDNLTVTEFQNKLHLIPPSKLLTAFIEYNGQELNQASFLLWCNNQIAHLPFFGTESEIKFWQLEILPKIGSPLIQSTIEKLYFELGNSNLVKITFEYLIEKGWDIKNNDELGKLVSIISKFRTFFPDVIINKSAFRTKDHSVLLQLYKARIINELPEEIFIQHIQNLRKESDKIEFILSLFDADISNIFSKIPELKDQYAEYTNSQIKKIIATIQTVAFDVETNGDQSISEYAFIDNDGNSKSQKNYVDFNQGIEELVENISSGKIIIGHNIKNYDLPILLNNGLSKLPEMIWDTLEIEMLLNPCRFSYGLMTTHTAIEDTENCYGLFCSQILRVALLPDNARILDFLPVQFSEKLERIRADVSMYLNSSIDPEKFAENYLRPTLSKNILSNDVISKLTEEINLEGFNIIIAPAFLWDSLSILPKVYFSSGELNYNYILNKSKVEEFKFEKEIHRVILLSYIAKKEETNTLPYWRHLPVILQILIGSEMYAVLCDGKHSDIQKVPGASFCVEPDNISAVEKVKHLKANFIYLGRELQLITSKHQLGEDLPVNHIFDKLKNEDVLLRMSGGKNYAKLNDRQCTLLGITPPNYVRNVWMEKFKKGSFKVWCNTDLLKCLQGIEVKTIQAIESNAKRDNTFIVRPSNSEYSADQYRLNPESLNRAMYWTYQLKIVAELALKQPTVLLVNDSEEIDSLNNLCTQFGFYVPDQSATLARRIELLNESNFPKRIIIVDIANFTKVLNSNYSKPLNFIWDSFLLYEKNQMLGDDLDEITRDFEIENDEQLAEIPSKDNKGFDMFGLIKAHKPLINHYASLIKLNNPDSILNLIDTRLTDFYGIESGFNVGTKKVSLWRTEAEYLEGSRGAKTFFKGDNFNEVKFEVEEAKQVLANIFLRTSEETKDNYWFDYQEKYLNKILPAKDDILISLPTGAGKSLLFQAPALYRSTFTNKLNIVISPLRALMQDQVEALWERGFISNVDFLSGDKSQMEIRDIYRRIAGGEITLLYITPERFRSKSFEKSFLIRMDADSGLEYVIFDEAHCISQWGQEFRPDYLNAGKKIAQFAATPPYEFRKLLFSATISEQVFEEITTLLPGIKAIEGVDNSYNPVRDHISINFKKDFDADDRLTEIAQYFKRGGLNPKLSKAIVFVKSRKRAEEGALLMPDVLNNVYGNKCEFANSVGAFHAGMDVEDRKEVYERYKSGDISILFATKAFGMGMDIPDIHFLSHFSPPSTFEDFLQEIGRAGRNEKKRALAGFNSTTNPIKAFCLADGDDFKNLKTQLHKSRITWEDIKTTKALLEKYISKFKTLEVNNEMPVAVPFTLASLDAGGSDDEADNKFRIALHWLEKLGRIKLGYFTITHLDISKESVKLLASKLNDIAEEDVKKVCSVLVAIANTQPEEGSTLQVPLSTLRSETKFGLEKLFKNLLIAHKTGLVELKQEIAAKHTEQRTAEVKASINSTFKSYIALNVAFDFARSIMEATPLNDARIFEGEELEMFLKEAVEENVTEHHTFWINKDNQSGIEKNVEAYKKDLITKRSKHAFTIIRLLDKTKHESKLEKTVDSNSKIFVKQSLFNGYKRKEDWKKKLNKMKDDCSKLLNIISRKNISDNQKKFNWADLIRDGYFPEDLQYVSDLFFILSVLGYIRTSSLLPSGIETYIISIKPIEEEVESSNDKVVYEEFKKTNEIRELKLIAMQALSGLEQSQHDEYIKKYFACNSLESLINMLQNYLPETDPIFQAFRGEAIKEREAGLNKEQRIVYDAYINQNINVVAGPGSGKTHTLSLRVAKLVHHIGISPDEILVLAYNRAVVSELKERLGKLFNDLGYSNIAKRLKIFTFHGMAKRYCKEEIGDADFGEWEDIFLSKLNSQPGILLNQLGKIKHILVDEFQDINDTRMDVLSMLTSLTESKIFIIGDPNQSIYGYDRSVTDPYHYYAEFNRIFQPVEFSLVNNHRSYPDIISTASRILNLPEVHKKLIPIPVKRPDDKFIKPYVEIFDNSKNWVDSVNKLLAERLSDQNGDLKPYNQIAILFRSNNEVYKGFQTLRNLNLQNVRIRIQGGLQYEFTRLRECQEIIEWIKSKNEINKRILLQEIRGKINELINQYPKWNHFYLKVMHSIVLDYFEQDDEKPSIDNLIEFITELSYKDDGQLYKIYEKHLLAVAGDSNDTEIVLTTMHKVKGLEFDAVITVPSITSLGNDERRSFSDVLDEERRLLFVSYTRAKYRLLIFKGERELAIEKGEEFILESVDSSLPVEPKLNKHVLNNNAKQYMFVSQNVNEYIRSSVKTGDLVSIRTKRVQYQGQQIAFKELIHNEKVVGSVSVKAVPNLEHIEVASDFVVNEVVVWSFKDTVDYDQRNDTHYQKDWCDEAKQKAFIYIVDFAGFGRTMK
jgi:RecQ family ATP-dependent DNA helicase